MVALVKFQDFVEQIGKGVHNLSTNTLKLMLTNSAPSAANTVKADITEISAGNGYTAGGITLGSIIWSEGGGQASLTIADPVLTASGGAIAAWRYAVLYNDTPTSPADPLICYWDYGSSITMPDGSSMTFDVSTVVFTIQ